MYTGASRHYIERRGEGWGCRDEGSCGNDIG